MILTIHFDQNVIDHGVKYGRLRTSDGQYVSSRWIKKNNKKARNNYCVQISIRIFIIIYLYYYLLL